MELLIALLIQSTAAPPPRLSYAMGAAERPAPRARGRGGVDWQALDQSLADGSRRERRRQGRRPAPGPRETIWNGVPVRIIDGQVHGIW